MSGPAAVLLATLALPLAAQKAAPAEAGVAQEDAPAALEQAASPLLEALETHRHPLDLEDGRLTGPGGELLTSEAGAARYTLVGETHGVAEAPALVAALFRALQPHGYRHLAVEIGPVQADHIGEILAGPRPMESYRAFLRDHWPAVPFYAWKSEAEMLVDAVEAGGGAAVLWGLDYDVMGDRWPLHRLRELAPGPEARAVLDGLVARADARLRQATRTGDLSRTMMYAEPASTWRDLRRAYEPTPGGEVDRILTQLQATARINEAWVAGERWTSNRRRARLLKHNFLRHRATADPGAKVLVKMGGFHLTRGRTPNNTHDLGNLLSELARAEGSAGGDDPALADSGWSFHVLVLGGPGRRRGAIDTRTLGVRAVPTVLSVPDQPYRPLGRAAFDDRWTLFDLRPLRPLADAGELGKLDARLEDVIFGYDAAVVLVASTPAEMLLETRPSLP